MRKPLSYRQIAGAENRRLLGRVGARLLQINKHCSNELSEISYRIAITAKNIGATGVMQRHLDADQHSANETVLSIPFVPLDKALNHYHDILFVEEAGTIPIPTLSALLSQCRHSVFATTTQGYEGAGRGFALRFSRTLDSLRPGWICLTPSYPVRWRQGDPLEALVNDALLLRTTLPPAPTLPALPHEISCRSVTPDELANNDQLLQQAFSLLIQAHYQTSAMDLRHLLDQPTMTLWVQRVGKQVCGAALIAVEGNIEPSLHPEILSRLRRLHNQLLPQQLAQTVDSAQALIAQYARVIRIAVHPDAQRHGLGTVMVKTIIDVLSPQVDAIGASFGADTATLEFWLGLGFKPIHLGHRINARSGMPSVCVLQTCNKRLDPLLRQACGLLCENLSALRRQAALNLSGKSAATIAQHPAQLLDTASFAAICQGPVDDNLTETDINRLQRFANNQRSFIDTAGALRRLYLHAQSAQSNPGNSDLWGQSLVDLAKTEQNPTPSRKQWEAALQLWTLTHLGAL